MAYDRLQASRVWAAKTPLMPKESHMRVEGKVALITGSASGMGQAEARLLAQEGAQVVVADILETEAQQVVADSVEIPTGVMR